MKLYSDEVLCLCILFPITYGWVKLKSIFLAAHISKFPIRSDCAPLLIMRKIQNYFIRSSMYLSMWNTKVDAHSLQNQMPIIHLSILLHQSKMTYYQLIIIIILTIQKTPPWWRSNQSQVYSDVSCTPWPSSLPSLESQLGQGAQQASSDCLNILNSHLFTA